MKKFHEKARLTLLSTFAVLAILSFTGVAYADNGISMKGSQWAVYEQTTLPNGSLNFYPGAHATTMSSGGVEFSMPDSTAAGPTYVNYLLDTYTVSLTEASTITATINVATSDPTTAFMGNPNGHNPSSSFVRLFIQANLPQDGSATCVGGNSNVLNYWWAHPASYTFTTGGTGGAVTLTATLNPSDWSGICGNSGTLNPAGFDMALANIKYIGLSFGSGNFFANGLGVDGTTGTATFQLLSYTIT
jgi:hypothetical protein